MPNPFKEGELTWNLKITLVVYRRLDNRFQGLSDDSPLALGLHNRRKSALHEVLDGEKSITVLSWGDTDDTRSHEFVQLILTHLASAVLIYPIVPGLKYVAEKLAEKAVDEGTSEIAKWLISKLRPNQESKKILDFEITFADGTTDSMSTHLIEMHTFELISKMDL